MRIVPNPYHWDRVNLSLFYGRSQLVTDIITDLSENHSSAVVGGRKMGKTTLLRKVENELSARIESSLASGVLVLPVYIHVLEISHPISMKKIYVNIVQRIERDLGALGLLGKSHLSLVPVFDEFPREENRAFASILHDIIETLSSRCFLQIAILVDEIEPLVSMEWSSGFFSNWRHLLSNEPDLSPHVSVVFSGAKEMSVIAKDVGSPLANILTWHELSLFKIQDTEQLINEPTSGLLPDSFVRRVFNWTGGHPFLIQFLMRYVCRFDIEEAEDRLYDARQQFFINQGTQFYSWWFEKFNDDDRRTYAYLADRHKAVPKRELVSFIGDIAANKAISVLCHTGIVRKAHRHEFYVIAGSMFKHWFLNQGGLSTGLSVFDKAIHESLMRINPELARKYMSAWSIHTINLPNYSGAVSEMRDVITLILNELAPDKDVMSQKDFVPEKDSKGNPLPKPTRRQRTEYMMRKKDDLDAKSVDADLELFGTLIKQLNRVVGSGYSKASARTHTVATRNQAWKCLKQLDSILAQLLL